MQVMCPGFREVFPGMHGGIGRYKTLLPINWRAIVIVTLQSRLVILRLITKKQSVGGEPLLIVTNEEIPIVMSDFVTKMPEQRAVGLVHLQTASFTLYFVSF